MAAIGGAIEEVSLGGRSFAVPHDQDTQRNLGGDQNEVQPNGNGTSRIIKTKVPWKVDGLTVEINNDNGDQEYLQGLANRNGTFPITVTYADGTIWQGDGTIVGEINYSNNSATATANLAGTGVMTKQ